MARSGQGARVPLSYRALTTWARTAVAVVYRDVTVTGVAQLPVGHPAILAANHGNALGDVAVIVAATPSFPHFLAAASWWKSAPARVLFRLGGVLPIHRRRDGEDASRNESAFVACNVALASGAHIVIFPEGEMHLEPTLLPLKTGAARIALSAVADAGVVDLTIVPVGLVYEDRGRLRSHVEVHFGEPIAVVDWLGEYRRDSSPAVRALTDRLSDALAAVTVNHGSAEETRVVDRAAALVRADEPAANGGHRFARRNVLRRDLGSAIESAGGVASVEFGDLADALAAHEQDLRRLGVRDGAAPIADASVADGGTPDARLMALALPAALGVVANAPMLAGVWIASRRVRDEAWQATTKGVVGTLLSPLVWSGEFVLLARTLGPRRTGALTAVGAACGVASLAWWDRFGDRRRARRLGAGAPSDLLDAARASRCALRQRVDALVATLTVAPAPRPVTSARTAGHSPSG